MGLLATLAANPFAAERVVSRVDHLAVPFLPQTEALCGGAAAAMIFRYWGDRRADVQQFAPLVDRRAGGIAEDVLVEAIRQRSWQAVRVKGTVDFVRARVADGQPVMLLIEDRPGRYHYVVAIGVDAESVYVHDPAWGPARRLALEQLTRAWRASNFWTLLVLPADPLRQPAVAAGEPPVVEPLANPTPEPATPCDRLLDDAIDELRGRGIGAADEVLGDVQRRCPNAAGPISELSGVRFAEHRWSDAAALATKAIALEPDDRYAWDVLGSSRFLQNNLHGALGAWNRIDRPQLDLLTIEGLSRTRYSLVAQALALTPNTLVTAEQYGLAKRRLEQLPGAASTRLTYRPDADGFAIVDVTIVERTARPRGLLAWAAEAARTLGTREVATTIPGNTGQGEVWSASWRWAEGRPRVAGSLALPTVGRLGGIWRVDAAWEARSYEDLREGPAPPQEEHVVGEVGWSNWLSSKTLVDLSAGMDLWNQERRTVVVGGRLERRLFGDRLAGWVSTQVWIPAGMGKGFRSSGAHASFATSRQARGMVHLIDAGVEGVTAAAPPAAWPASGAGDTRARLTRLLRDAGDGRPPFGRRLEYAAFETRRWFEKPSPVRLGIAVFGDVARASHLGTPVGGARVQGSVGAGLRIALQASGGTFRVDYRRDLHDGHGALTFGWQF